MSKNFDRKLHIETGNQGVHKVRQEGDFHYEATPYPFLDALFSEHTLKRTDQIVDFGSGKGRVLFYIYEHFGNVVTGVEKDNVLHEAAIVNKNSYVKQNKKGQDNIKLIFSSAEKYVIQPKDNVFYFFNPFSLETLKQVLENILRSARDYKRKIDVIFYYPRPEYVDYLGETPFTLYKEVMIPGISTINKEERFLIYRLA